MNDRVLESAKRFVQRARAAGFVGRTIKPDAAEALLRDTKEQVPRWYVELLVDQPLAEIVFDVGAPDEEGFRPHALLWNDESGIRSESIDCYPGLAILERGYFNCATDPTGGGDPYFLSGEGGEDPVVYQVYHDISDQADEILAESRVVVAESLSALFDAAVFE